MGPMNLHPFSTTKKEWKFSPLLPFHQDCSLGVLTLKATGSLPFKTESRTMTFDVKSSSQFLFPWLKHRKYSNETWKNLYKCKKTSKVCKCGLLCLCYASVSSIKLKLSALPEMNVNDGDRWPAKPWLSAKFRSRSLKFHLCLETPTSIAFNGQKQGNTYSFNVSWLKIIQLKEASHLSHLRCKLPKIISHNFCPTKRNEWKKPSFKSKAAFRRRRPLTTTSAPLWWTTTSGLRLDRSHLSTMPGLAPCFGTG